MPPLVTIRELFAHMEWSDARVWAVVRRSDAADGDAFVRDTLLHLHQTQRRFLNLWTNQLHTDGMPTKVDSLANLNAWARPYYAQARSFFATASPAVLQSPVPAFVRLLEEHVGPGQSAITLGDTAFQVVSHTTHHRGQVNRRLRDLGGEPVGVDYILWVWGGRPNADWSASA